MSSSSSLGCTPICQIPGLDLGLFLTLCHRTCPSLLDSLPGPPPPPLFPQGRVWGTALSIQAEQICPPHRKQGGHSYFYPSLKDFHSCFCCMHKLISSLGLGVAGIPVGRIDRRHPNLKQILLGPTGTLLSSGVHLEQLSVALPWLLFVGVRGRLTPCSRKVSST